MESVCWETNRGFESLPLCRAPARRGFFYGMLYLREAMSTKKNKKAKVKSVTAKSHSRRGPSGSGPHGTNKYSRKIKHKKGHDASE